MPTLHSIYAIYTDGEGLRGVPAAPAGVQVDVAPVDPLVGATAADELFGPHAAAFRAHRPQRAFLVSMRREQHGNAEGFFLWARGALVQLTEGVAGFGLDVLRLYPFPLASAADALPEDLLPEDLFSVAIAERGDHGFEAETIGLSRLGQRELSFGFRGHELVEEAALLCGHFAEWLIDHGRRVEPGQAMSFGFDRLVFRAPRYARGPTERAWQPALVQRLVPEALFPGVGVLKVESPPALPGDEAAPGDLTTALRRAMEQRLSLEEFDLTGDSPHSTTTALVTAELAELRGVEAVREEPSGPQDSGWRVRRTGGAGGAAVSLVELGTRLPGLVRLLAMPIGVRLSWGDDGHLSVDRSRVALDDDFDDALPGA